MSRAIVLWRPPLRSYVVLPDGLSIARPWDPSGEYVEVWPIRVPHPDAWRWTPEWKERRFARSLVLTRFTRVLLLLFVVALVTFEWYFLVSMCAAFALRFA